MLRENADNPSAKCCTSPNGNYFQLTIRKLTLYSTDTHFNASTTDNEQFLLFPQCFQLNQKVVPHLSIFLTSYLYLEEPKIGMGGK